jgi:hypothetical protein
MRILAAVAVGVLALLCTQTEVSADTKEDRFQAAGYFRVMARPDLQGGDSRLGFWNLYGRLLNEGPWATLELRLSLLKEDPTTKEVWSRVHAKIEGGSVTTVDSGDGGLQNFRLTQLYVQAGNILLEDVTWQLGTLESYFGDLGLYDFRPTTIFNDTVGVSGRYRKGPLELLVGLGDAGFSTRGDEYSTILSGGGSARVRVGKHVEVGLGGQYYFEPKVEGNRFAPYDTPGVDYEDFVRGEVAQDFLEENPGMEDFFPRPVATSSKSWRTVGYLGFGGVGPLVWNNLFASFTRVHPENFTTEEYMGRTYSIYTNALTDQRYRFDLGTEMQLRLIPERLDLVVAGWWGYHVDKDNDIVANDNDRSFLSAVGRLQLYLTGTTHLLAESSIASEKSTNGNLYRKHKDSVFESSGGIGDPRGLEFGDTDTRKTWQGKIGWVLNPLGFGVYTRPSLRLLYGVQYSNQNNAFGNNFIESLDDFNFFPNKEQHWHHLLALEAEAWF